MIYWLIPRLFQTDGLAKPKWAELHFWLGTIGILLYIVAIYGAGLTQGLMWRAFDAEGFLKYPDFMESVTVLIPMYWVRALGGTLYLAGMVLALLNLWLTWKKRPAQYQEKIYQAPALPKAAPVAVTGFMWHEIIACLAVAGVMGAVALVPGITESRPAASLLSLLAGLGLTGATYFLFKQVSWHRIVEGRSFLFSVLIALSVVTASLFEIIPTFAIEANVPVIESVKPYSPLELVGRDVYIREGCYNCHSQMVRPLHAETERYGEYSKAGEFVYDHPFQWGSRRIGPDLHRVGSSNRNLTAGWHTRHMLEPRATSPDSIMPAYPNLFEEEIDFENAHRATRAMATLGVPYTNEEVSGASAAAREQAALVAAQIVKEQGPSGLESKRITALIAYLMRLGRDIEG